MSWSPATCGSAGCPSTFALEARTLPIPTASCSWSTDVRCPAGTAWRRRGEALQATTDARFGDGAARRFDAASQLGAMDMEGIDLAVLFPSRTLATLGIDDIDHELAAEVARAYNDWLAEFCAEDGGRLFGMAALDLHDPQRAAAEAQRCVTELGFVGVMMRPNPIAGRPLYHAAYEDLWSTIEELDVPVCFHEGTAVLVPQVGPDRFERHGLWHVCSHPMEQQIAMVAMVLGGVLARHPGLRAGFMECGAGWLPYWAWRMDESWEMDGARDCPDLTMPPSEYVRRQCVVGADSDEPTAADTVRHLGSGGMVWGSDYPHPDSKFPHALGSLRALPGISEDDLTHILWDNPQRFFGTRLRQAAVELAATRGEAPGLRR
jgi:predicted TIM-barrel fold metal-dependent hydrolase